MSGTTILLVDYGEGSMDLLAARIGRLGIRTLRVKTPSDAYVALSNANLGLGAAIIPHDAPFADLRGGLARLREVSAEPTLSIGVAGQRPDHATRTQFEAAGIDFAIYEPIDAHALRFQLNGATAWRHSTTERQADRAPFMGAVRMKANGRTKEGRLYTLSPRGAFVALAAPWLRGTEIKVEIELPDGVLFRTKGHVAMTNVRGNLQTAKLPVGMGLRFGRVREAAEARLALSVIQRLESLQVAR